MTAKLATMTSVTAQCLLARMARAQPAGTRIFVVIARVAHLAIVSNAVQRAIDMLAFRTLFTLSLLSKAGECSRPRGADKLL